MIWNTYGIPNVWSRNNIGQQGSMQNSGFGAVRTRVKSEEMNFVPTGTVVKFHRDLKLAIIDEWVILR